MSEMKKHADELREIEATLATATKRRAFLQGRIGRDRGQGRQAAYVEVELRDEWLRGWDELEAEKKG